MGFELVFFLKGFIFCWFRWWIISSYGKVVFYKDYFGSSEDEFWGGSGGWNIMNSVFIECLLCETFFFE